MRTSPTFRRRRLARRLRQMREKAGLNIEDAARLLDKSRSSLARIETGQSRADVHLIRSMMDIYDHYDPDLLDLAREANRPGWWARYTVDDRGWISMETEASVELEFSVLNIPGLLQTEGYMRALFASGKVRRSRERLANDVAARLHRQRRLTEEEFPLRLVAIIDEAALRRKVGGVEVMRDQLGHLVMVSELSTVSVQVLPNEAGAHSGMDGAFIILTFPEDEDPSVLYVEYPTGSLQVERPEEVTEARLVFDRLRSEALSPSDSVAFIEKMADELHGE
ncbi:helix-turn-helix domain-containing protein [Actinophytocola sp.]|uniref:helix-turn-helix domain-containing protein n=1 Tax=Actinophytocola sp. TaxID=1872138 RepID=UPI002ED0D028